MVGEPYYKKVLHMLSMVLRQPYGSIKAELQKLTVLMITDMIN